MVAFALCVAKRGARRIGYGPSILPGIYPPVGAGYIPGYIDATASGSLYTVI